MDKLIMGIVEFREKMLPQYSKQFSKLALAQTPDALFITCSDSRVVPDLLASTHPGDLFTMRNVGNLIPPATAEGVSTGDLSEASAIEYAVLVLKVRILCVRAFRVRCDESRVTRNAKLKAPNLDNGCTTRTTQRFASNTKVRSMTG